MEDNFIIMVICLLFSGLYFFLFQKFAMLKMMLMEMRGRDDDFEGAKSTIDSTEEETLSDE